MEAVATFNIMVERQAGVDAVFAALAHPARREMLDRLARSPHTVGELAAPLAMSFAAASKHVRVLEAAGLLRRTVTGRTHVCRLDPAPLARATAWLRVYEQHWSGRLDALADLLAADDPGTGPTPTTGPTSTTGHPPAPGEPSGTGNPRPRPEENR